MDELSTLCGFGHLEASHATGLPPPTQSGPSPTVVAEAGSHLQIPFLIISNEWLLGYLKKIMQKSEKQISYINAYMWNLEKWYRQNYLQCRNRDTDIEKKGMDTKRGREWWIGGLWLTYIDSVQFSHLVVSDSLRPHESQHARPPCPSQTPRVYSNSCPSSWWCHPAISSCVIPFSSCPQSFPASESFKMSQLFATGGQSIGVSASTSVLPRNTQDWSPLGWTYWISLQSKGL